MNGKPVTYFFLTASNGYLEVVYGPIGNKTTRKINDADDYNSFFAGKIAEAGGDKDELTVMCSSSVDFPEDYTSDADVIALCHAIK